MNSTLIKSFVALLPVSMLLVGSIVSFHRDKATHSVLQLLGAMFLTVVIFAHLSEALHLFPWMGWGLEHSVGHSLDLASALLAGTLFPMGYLLQSLWRKK